MLSWLKYCSAVRLIRCIPKYASVSDYMRDALHWLPNLHSVHQLYNSCPGLVLHFWPVYLWGCCCPVLTLVGLRTLHSSGIEFFVAMQRSPPDSIAHCQLFSSQLELTPIGDSPAVKEYCPFVFQAAYILAISPFVGLEVPPSSSFERHYKKILNLLIGYL